MVNSFRWEQHCAAIIQHLLYGMEKMHCHRAAVKEPLKDSQGCWGFDRDTGWWVVVKQSAYYSDTEVVNRTARAEKWNIGAQEELYSWAKFENRSLRCKKLVNIPHNFSGAEKSLMGLCIRSQCSSIVGQNAAVSTGARPGGNETLCRRRQKIPLIPRLSIKHLKLRSAQLRAATVWVCVGKHVRVTKVFIYATRTNTIINHPAQCAALWDVFLHFFFVFLPEKLSSE